ncbi:MAG: tRNA lysidine(34) synthetase TilS [Chloroflexota bacterium]|nr:tRNA lysidine(34) synthetase TilS [Chloroflexota bacterium]
MVNLESRLIDFIQQHNLISPGETVVVGVSGGADSICLLCLLDKWRNKLDIKLHIAHLNHGLRGIESEADATYVADLASSFSIPITIDKQDVVAYKAQKKCSLEEAARELRYAFFAKVAEKTGARRVAIGHTKDDQVETILMHILRGAGTSGLRGLELCSPMVYGKGVLSRGKQNNLLVIRPLLDITRVETLNYCHEYRLNPRTDSSNLSLSFFRNRLRLELLPMLRKYNPNVDGALLRLAEIAAEDNSFVEQQALQIWDKVAEQENGVIYLDKGEISTLSVALQRQLIKLSIARMLGDIRDIEANHIEAARALLSKETGKRIYLPHGLVCQGEYDELVLSLSPFLPCPFPPLGGKSPLAVPGETILPGWKVLASISSSMGRISPVTVSGSFRRSEETVKQSSDRFPAEFDLHQTGNDLFVRRRQQGDGFQPLGMSMTKKLRDFMVDAKIPCIWRDNVPIVCSPGQILWVVGWRIDDRVKVTENTREILRLEFIKSS